MAYVLRFVQRFRASDKRAFFALPYEVLELGK
jgi:hypothetical protein